MGIIDDKRQQIEEIKNGKGVKFILDSAYRILGNPILVHDMAYKVIACTENTVTDDPIWNEFVATGKVGDDMLQFYKAESFFETVANSKKITFLISGKLKYDRIFGKLFTKNNIQVGNACLVICCKPFENGDMELFEAVCDVLNREFIRSRHYQKYGHAYIEALISKLIGNNIKDKALYTAHLENLYIGTKSNLYVSVVDISQCDPSFADADCFMDELRHARPDYKYARYSAYIIIIMSSGEAVFRIKDGFEKLFRIFDKFNMYVGISSRFENMLELPKYYDQAECALLHGLKSAGDNRFFLFDDVKGGL